jgi:hypothetical protein
MGQISVPVHKGLRLRLRDEHDRGRGRDRDRRRRRRRDIRRRRPGEKGRLSLLPAQRVDVGQGGHAEEGHDHYLCLDQHGRRSARRDVPRTKERSHSESKRNNNDRESKQWVGASRRGAGICCSAL